MEDGTPTKRVALSLRIERQNETSRLNAATQPAVTEIERNRMANESKNLKQRSGHQVDMLERVRQQ